MIDIFLSSFMESWSEKSRIVLWRKTLIQSMIVRKLLLRDGNVYLSPADENETERLIVATSEYFVLIFGNLFSSAFYERQN